MEKIWYTYIQGHVEGPWSVEDLKRNRRVTPDTLVRKEGSTKWVPIRAVPELKALFADEKPPKDKDKGKGFSKGPTISYSHDQIVLDARQEPPYLFWLLIALIALAYMFIYTHLNR